MVTAEFSPILYLALKNTAFKSCSIYERERANCILKGLNAAFKRFRVNPHQCDIIAEAVLRWRILKDVGIPQPKDIATKRLFEYDDFLTEWLHTKKDEIGSLAVNEVI